MNQFLLISLIYFSYLSTSFSAFITCLFPHLSIFFSQLIYVKITNTRPMWKGDDWYRFQEPGNFVQMLLFCFSFTHIMFICLYFLADVCKDYQPLKDGTRKYDYTTANSKCDDILHGWYRFQEPGGTKMVTKCPVSTNKCGAHYPAWLKEDHPTVAEGTVTRKVCILRNANCCYDSVNIQVKNCSSYYIYKLLDPGSCNTRYCSMD